jgi:hypothetical protein
MTPSEYEYHKSIDRSAAILAFVCGAWCGITTTLLFLLCGGK